MRHIFHQKASPILELGWRRTIQGKPWSVFETIFRNLKVYRTSLGMLPPHAPHPIPPTYHLFYLGVCIFLWLYLYLHIWPMQHNCIWICSICMFPSQTCPTPAHPHTISLFVYFCGCICIFTWPMQHNCIWICSICMFTSKTCSPYFPSSPISFWYF